MRFAIAVALVAWAFSGLARADASQGGIKEHHLVPQSSSVPPPKVSEDVEPAAEPDWVRQHLLEGGDFADSFLGPKLYPKVSLGTSFVAPRLKSGGKLQYVSTLDIQLYFLELSIPLVSRLGDNQGPSHVRATLKIPFAVPGHESHRFVLLASALVMEGTPSLSRSSSAQVMYGFANDGLTLQLRGGYGYEKLVTGSSLQLGWIYGALLGLRASFLQPMVEFDGFRAKGTREDQLMVIPGIHIYPDSEDTLEIGLGALFSCTRGESNSGWRYGGIVQIAFNFL